jgi:hypothetical protein
LCIVQYSFLRKKDFVHKVLNFEKSNKQQLKQSVFFKKQRITQNPFKFKMLRFTSSRYYKMFEPTAKVIRNSKYHANHDGNMSQGILALMLLGCVAVFIGMWKVIFKNRWGWERASMPTRQDTYDKKVWAGGVTNPELLETVHVSRPHRGPQSRHQVELNRLEYGGSKQAVAVDGEERNR